MKLHVIAVAAVLAIAGVVAYKALGRADAAVTPQSPPKTAERRIIATDGALTEIVYALGFGKEIVAADLTAKWPLDATKKPSIGYVRRLSAEGILSLSPTLVINNADAGPAEVIDQLRAAGLKFHDVPGEKMARSFPAILQRIRSVAAALGVPEKGELLAADVEADLGAVRKAVSGRKGVKTLFLFNPTMEKVTAAGKGTGADEFMKLVGLQNVAGNLESWKPLTQESIVDLAPELLIATSNRDSHNQFTTVDELLTIHGLARTPAGKSRHVIFVDSSKFLSGGPRVGLMAIEFAKMVYPDLAFPRSRSADWFSEVEKQFNE